MPPSVQILLMVLGVLASAGALAFFIKFGTRLAFAERDSTTALARTEQHNKDVAALQTRVTSMESTLESISTSLSKLHLIDQISSKCDVLKERIDETRRDTGELKADLRDLLRQANTPHV